MPPGNLASWKPARLRSLDGSHGLQANGGGGKLHLARNGVEVPSHTDPQHADTDSFSLNASRYSVRWGGLSFRWYARLASNDLILEAARRTDEKTPRPSAADPVSGSEPPLPDPVAESLLGIRARIENELGAGCGVEDAFQDPVWNERVKRISRHGEQLKLGKLIMAYVGRGEPRDHIVLPGENATVLAVNPKCPRGKIMRILGG